MGCLVCCGPARTERVVIPFGAATPPAVKILPGAVAGLASNLPSAYQVQEIASLDNGLSRLLWTRSHGAGSYPVWRGYAACCENTARCGSRVSIQPAERVPGPGNSLPGQWVVSSVVDPLARSG